MPGSLILFLILAAIAVATAVGMLLSRNTVYSALFLVLNFATVAVLYMMLGAPFISLAQITVYAGSIMVLFLFVIMLLGAERLPASDSLRWQPFLAIPLALILAGLFGYQLFRWTSQLPAAASLPAGFGTPSAMGNLLFTQFVLPFEITAVILLSATVGAILLAKPDKPSVGQAVRRAEVTQVGEPADAEVIAARASTTEEEHV